MPIGIAAGIAGAGILGDLISSQGAQATNAQSFSNTETLLNQTESYDTQMSNTAMQRRVQDLQSAGLNPLLAVSEGGASTPTVSPGAPNLQNPGAAYNNVGQISASAMGAAQQQQQNLTQLAGTQSQVNLNSAQADVANSQAALNRVNAAKAAGVDTAAQQQSIAESQTRQMLENANAKQATASAALTNTQQAVMAQTALPKIQAEIAALGASANRDEAQAHLSNISAITGTLSNTQMQSIMGDVLSTAHSTALQNANNAALSGLALPKADADAAMWKGNPGVSYLNAIMNMFHIGANIGN